MLRGRNHPFVELEKLGQRFGKANLVSTRKAQNTVFWRRDFDLAALQSVSRFHLRVYRGFDYHAPRRSLTASIGFMIKKHHVVFFVVWPVRG